MPRPVEDRSDVGGAAQFTNIGPVPLSNIGPVPLSPASRFPLSPAFRTSAFGTQYRTCPAFAVPLSRDPGTRVNEVRATAGEGASANALRGGAFDNLA